MKKTGILRNKRGRTGFINPNQRLENEYVGNMQRQIHFLNLEISAFKKKHHEGARVQQMKGLSSQQKALPLEHLIEAKDKFGDMLKRHKEKKSRIEDDLLRRQQDEFELGTFNQVLGGRKNELERDIKQYREAQTKVLKELGGQLDVLKRNNYEVIWYSIWSMGMIYGQIR